MGPNENYGLEDVVFHLKDGRERDFYSIAASLAVPEMLALGKDCYAVRYYTEAWNRMMIYSDEWDYLLTVDALEFAIVTRKVGL